MTSNNTNKVVVISGGTDGLGYSLAKQFSKNNIVYILSPTIEKLRKVSEELKCKYVQCDISDVRDIKNSVLQVVKNEGRVDILVNNAGVWLEGELTSNSYLDIKKTLEVNTLGTIYLTKAISEVMQIQGYGLIVNVNSQSGLYHKSNRSIYTASKWALTGFFKCLVPEMSKYNIRFINLFPSKLNTKMISRSGVESTNTGSIEPSDLSELLGYLVNTNNKLTFTEIGVVNLDNMK